MLCVLYLKIAIKNNIIEIMVMGNKATDTSKNTEETIALHVRAESLDSGYGNGTTVKGESNT